MSTDLSAARGGDLAAFNRLVAAHQDQLFTLTYRALGDEGAAIDAVQAAVLQARRQIRRCAGDRFQLWLLQWGVQACQERLGRDGAPGSQAAYFQDQTPEVGLAADLCRLPEDLRLAIILVDVVGLDYAEVATVLGASREQVSRRVAEARRRLMGNSPHSAQSAG